MFSQLLTSSLHARIFSLLVFLRVRLDLALTRVFGGAIFGSLSGLEGPFPSIFPFTLVKEVYGFADLLSACSVYNSS